MIDLQKIQEEFIKCVADRTRIYMIENYLKTYDMRERKKVPFALFPRQKDLLMAFQKYLRNIVTKPRQSGITTVTAAYLACEIALASADSPETVLIVGRDLKLSQNLLEKIEEFLSQIPRWFWGSEYFSPDPKSDVNKKDIFLIHNKSRLELANGCKVYAVSSGTNAARGISSVSWLVFDEAAFIENGLAVYAQAVATTSTGGHTIMISTPYGKDQLYYGIYNNALLGKNDFHITELRWHQDPRYNCNLRWVKKDEETGQEDVITDPIINEKGEVAYLPDKWKELIKRGYKPISPWYEGMCAALNNDPQKIAQELDVSFIGSSNNVVDTKFIDQQRDLNSKEPDPTLKDVALDDVWIWKAPIEGHRYLMAIDNSRGDADDSTALEIIDLDGIDDDGLPCIEQVLEYNGKLYGNAVGDLAVSYGRMYNEAFCVVESIGGYGDATILTMLDLGYKNMYYDDSALKQYTLQSTPYSASLRSAEANALPGFHNSTLRPQILSNFANLVRTNQFKIRSTRVIAELETWVWKNGRPDHMDGCHDDTLTCLAMGLFVMQYSLNRKETEKNKDKAFLKAMIAANNRLVYNPNASYNSKTETNKDVVMPIYTGDMLEKNNARNSYMWLFK